MASSYDIVSSLYCETQIWMDYVETVRRRLQTMKISTATFDVRSDPRDPKPYFRCSYDGAFDSYDTSKKKEFHIYKSERENVPAFKIDWDWVNDPDETAGVCRKIWAAKVVPTYNCKLEKTQEKKDANGKVRKGPKDQNYLTKHFPEYARYWIANELDSVHEQANARIRLEIINWYESPEYVNRRVTTVERTAIDEIKAALLRYRHLDESVLKTAFLEFITEDILTQ